MITIKDINSKAPKWDWTKIIFTLLGVIILIALIAMFYVSRKNMKIQAPTGTQPAGGIAEMPGTTNITPETVPDVQLPAAGTEVETNATHVTPEKAIEMV